MWGWGGELTPSKNKVAIQEDELSSKGFREGSLPGSGEGAEQAYSGQSSQAPSGPPCGSCKEKQGSIGVSPAAKEVLGVQSSWGTLGSTPRNCTSPAGDILSSLTESRGIIRV